MTETLRTIELGRHTIDDHDPDVNLERLRKALEIMDSTSFEGVVQKRNTVFANIPELRVLVGGPEGTMLPLFGCGYEDPDKARFRAAADLLNQIVKAGRADNGSQLVLVEPKTLKLKARIVIPQPQ